MRHMQAYWKVRSPPNFDEKRLSGHGAIADVQLAIYFFRMQPRLHHGLTVLGRSLWCALLGAFAYSCIGNVLVRGDRAIAIHGHFRLPDVAMIPSLTLLMTPFAMPSAVICVLSLSIIENLPSRYAALAFAACTLLLLPALILAFPRYMSALDTSNDWCRGMMLPAAVYVVAVGWWIFGVNRSTKTPGA